MRTGLAVVVRMPVVRLACVLLLVVALTSGCRATSSRGRGGPQAPVPAATPTAAVVIEVFGTEGLRFEGSYGELGDTKPVSGTVPARLTFKTGVGFSVALQKRTPQGELGIKITVEGKVVSEAKTVKEYGVVTYTHRLPGK